ncbi:hypothetical protein [Abyssisolibacter fermentans]|uniref:hypothetical protein n=1 Tax=Abyssisolibacter fermentans TaxID=1766203 RepID=UPI00083369F6|nr:hypothetical protein [Abyssisolibacter fermentans]
MMIIIYNLLGLNTDIDLDRDEYNRSKYIDIEAKEKGNFNDVIMSNYDQDKKFVDLKFRRKGTDDEEERKKVYNNTDLVSELLDYINTFEFQKLEKDYKWSYPYDNYKYYMVFTQEKTYSNLDIFIIDEKTVYFGIYNYVKKIDDEKKRITNDNEVFMGYYESTNSKLDFDYLDKVFYSMDESE